MESMTEALRPSLLVLGPFLVDRLRGDQPCRAWDHPGGNGLICACVAARLGLTTRLMAQLGDDEEARALADFLVRHGVQSEGFRTVEGQPSKLSVLAVEERGSWRTLATWPRHYPYLGMPDVHGDLPPSHPRVQIMGLCSLLRSCGPEVAAWVERARSRAWRLGFGLNKLDPGEGGAVEQLLGPEDALFCNLEEYLAWRGLRTDRRVAIEADAANAPCGDLVVTLGPDGVLARARGEEPFHLPAASVDTTSTLGAGDVLCAVTTCARMRGLSLREAVELGQRAAARSVRDETWYAWLSEEQGLLGDLRAAISRRAG